LRDNDQRALVVVDGNAQDSVAPGDGGQRCGRIRMGKRGRRGKARDHGPGKGSGKSEANRFQADVSRMIIAPHEGGGRYRLVDGQQDIADRAFVSVALTTDVEGAVDRFAIDAAGEREKVALRADMVDGPVVQCPMSATQGENLSREMQLSGRIGFLRIDGTGDVACRQRAATASPCKAAVGRIGQPRHRVRTPSRLSVRGQLAIASGSLQVERDRHPEAGPAPALIEKILPRSEASSEQQHPRKGRAVVVPGPAREARGVVVLERPARPSSAGGRGQYDRERDDRATP
jgi:hypothetical protein